MSKLRQQSLFDDDLPPATSVMEALVRGTPEGKSQLAFRKLVERIASHRRILEEWREFSVRYQQRISGELHPLNLELRAGQREMAILIDELLEAPKGPSKTNRKKLVHIVLNLAEGLLEENPEDPEIEAIHDRYAELSHAEVLEMNHEMDRSLLEEMLGMDLPQFDSSAEMFEFAQSKLREAEEKRKTTREEKRKKKSAEKGPDKKEIALKEASISVREVYRKLASALHPDREADPAEREKKTVLMQKVNNAYDANDLITLLNLQLEIEQIDAEHILSLSESRLKHYMEILKSQLKELKDEIAVITHPFSRITFGRLSPAAVDRELTIEIENLRLTVRDLKDEIEAFRDPARLRERLKDYVISREEDAYFDDPWQGRRRY